MRCPRCGYTLDNETTECPECKKTFPTLHPLFNCIAKIEDTLLCLLLGSMILLVLIQIVLRNLFATGIIGGAEIVRHLVLWVAFIAAGITARDGKHIRIDIAYRFLPIRIRQYFELITGLFSIVICLILFYASINFLTIDYSFDTTIAFYNTPAWILEIIIPVGYLAVALRFTTRFFHCLSDLLRGG